MATVSNPTPATLEEAVALLGALATEKRLLELDIEDLEHRLFGSSSEKLPRNRRAKAGLVAVLGDPPCSPKPEHLCRGHSLCYCQCNLPPTKIPPVLLLVKTRINLTHSHLGLPKSIPLKDFLVVSRALFTCMVS